MRALATRFGLVGIASAALLALLLLAPVGGGNSALAGGACDRPVPSPVPIPTGGTATIDCTVSDPGVIKDLNVTVFVTHTFTGDLAISLTHVKTGTTVLLINKRCGGGDNIIALLDDEAADPVGTFCDPISGRVRPDSLLSAFDGEGFAGTWRLTVTDQVGLEPVGTVSAFDLFASTNHGIKKDPRLANLWLCNQGHVNLGPNLCDNKASGVEEVNLNVELNEQVTGESKGEPQSIGSFEFEVRYDAKLLNVDVTPGDLLIHPDVTCNTIRREGSVQFACLTKGKERVVFGPGTLAVVSVSATADVYSMLVANQQNGIATQLINQDCQLADLQGHPIKIDACSDAAVTIRYLEGDVHADCVVDAIDQQQIAFRWGSRLGNLLYNSRMDLEPSQPIKGDGDIDAKDLQFVYGRHGSTCKAPHPAQDPVDPKAK